MKDNKNNIEVEFREVSKSFIEARTGELVRVFDGFSLSIARNEFVGIVGTTGTGKTTLLNLTAGFIQPDHGIVCRRRQPVTKPEREAMMVFQEFALLRRMTVYQNIEFGLVVNGTDNNRRRRVVEELIAQMGLQGAEQRYPRNYLAA